MSNISDLIPDWIQEKFPYRADLYNMSIALSGIYTFNFRKFSYRAAYVQNERQKKSAGSFLIGGFVMLYKMKADSSFVPESLLKLGGRGFKGMDSTSFVTMNNIGLSVGYGRTFVYKNWYINLTTVPGLSLQIFSTKDAEGDFILKQSARMGMRFLGRFSVGVNKERYFAGFQSVFESYTLMNSKLTSFEYMYGHVRLFYGRRFNLSRKK